MNDLFKLQEQSKIVLYDANAQRKKHLMMLGHNIPEHKIQAVRTRYFQLMHNYMVIIKTIQKITYEKYI
jgi:hypothetical protein